MLASLWGLLHICSQHAQAQPARIELGAKLGLSWETHAGDREFAENTFKTGGSAGAVLRYGLLQSLFLQAELLYATRGSDVKFEGETLAEFRFTYLQIPLLLRYELPGPRPAGTLGGRPRVAGYIAVGPGLSALLGAKDALDGRTLSRDGLSSLDIGVMGELGVIVTLTPRWAVSLGVRGDMGLVDVFSTGSDFKNRAILLSLSIDGTLKKGGRHGGGSDSDGDGVLDARDQCPTKGEDWNGYRDEDGCPDDDDDTDGVVAGLDKCPAVAEDPDGFEDHDGCPDLDNDGDGLLDRDDMCPDDAFRYNKALKHDKRGCSPKLEGVRVRGDVIELDKPLVFDIGKAELSADNKKTLDQVFELLTDYYPDMELRLEGHTDEKTGTKALNLKLSRTRAEAVKTYLQDKGIAPARLNTRAQGSDRPEYFDDKRNRRVDLFIEKP